MFRDVDKASTIRQTNAIRFMVDFNSTTIVMERVRFDEWIKVIAAKTTSMNAFASLRARVKYF